VNTNGQSILLDASGNILVLGTTSTDLPGFSGSLTTGPSILVRFDPTGVFQCGQEGIVPDAGAACFP
jgi:hypothetical protein